MLLIFSTRAAQAAGFEDEVEQWLRDNLNEYGTTAGDIWRDYRTYCYVAAVLILLFVLYLIYKIVSKILKKLTNSETAFGRFLARQYVPILIKKNNFYEAAQILERLGEKKEAADTYFKGSHWPEAAELYFSLGVKLKAARAYEKVGNNSTAAITYEELGEYEAAERCYRKIKDLRSVASMYSKIGQHKKAAKLFKEMGLSRDEAEALELANMHEEALAIWKDLFSNYEPDATTLTPLALRERNTVAAHVYLNMEEIDFDQAREFLAGVSLAEGIPEVFQKRGEFQKATEIRELITSIMQSRAAEESTAPSSLPPEQDSDPGSLMEQRRVATTSTPNLMGGRGSPMGPSDPPDVDLTQPIQGGGEAPAAPVGQGSEESLNQRAQMLMDQRDFSAAGDLFEEAGNHMRAIDAYELALNCPEEGFGDGAITAWQRELIDRIQWLYERNGSPELGAEFLQRIGLRGEAVDLFMKVGDRSRAAQILEEDRKFEAAAQIYQQLGDQQKSIRCLAQARTMVGDLPSAGDLYAEIGDLPRAAGLYDEARKKGMLNDGQWRERMNALGPGMAPPPAPPRNRGTRAVRRPQGGPPPPPPGAPNRPRGRTRRTGALNSPGPNQRPRRATRGGPMPRALQADVSALHRLPGSVPDAPKGPPPPRRRNTGPRGQNPPPPPPNPHQSGIMPNPHQSGIMKSGIMRPARGQPGQGIRRTPTRRLSGAMNRVMNQNPPPPPPPPPPATRSGIRRPNAPGAGRRRNPGPPPPPPPQRPPQPGQREPLRRTAPPPPPSARNSGLYRRNPGPGNNHSMMAQAEELEHNGQLREAAGLYLQAGANGRARELFKQVEDWKAVADSWRAENKRYEAGILYFVLGQIDDAIRELTRVPDEDPDALPARRVAAILYGLIGRLADAKTYFDVSFSESVGNDDIESLYYYAQVLEQDDRTWEDALDFYATVLELNPNYRDTRQRMGSLQQGQPSPVSSIYEDAERDRSSLFYVLQEAVMAR